MDHKIIWSPAALEDVESIAEFITRDSEFYARAVVEKILVRVKNLRDFPLTGRIVPELGDEAIRECFVHNYRIIYRLKNREITILAIIHGKRILISLNDRIHNH
jgi:toxin ParE1/3/4